MYTEKSAFLSLSLPFPLSPSCFFIMIIMCRAFAYASPPSCVPSAADPSTPHIWLVRPPLSRDSRHDPRINVQTRALIWACVRRTVTSDADAQAEQKPVSDLDSRKSGTRHPVGRATCLYPFVDFFLPFSSVPLSNCLRDAGEEGGPAWCASPPSPSRRRRKKSREGTAFFVHPLVPRPVTLTSTPDGSLQLIGRDCLPRINIA